MDLASAFEAEAGAPLAADERAAVEAALTRALEEGRREYPEVALAPPAFAREIALRVAGDDPPSAAIASLHAADLYLACACASGDARAARAFDDRFLSLVPAFLTRIAPSTAFADEQRQDLRVHLLVGDDRRAPPIAQYSGRGPLKAWLRVTAVRAALRSLRAPNESDEELDQLIGDGNPELALLRGQARTAFHAAFRAALAALAPEERSVLKLYVLDGLSIDELSGLLGVHRATAARRVAAVRQSLCERIVEELRARLGMSGPELQSLLGAVRSQIDVSLQGLLASVERERGSSES
jgi:RNA polymerase sigma-70 factor (ECF subfamily)